MGLLILYFVFHNWYNSAAAVLLLPLYLASITVGCCCCCHTIQLRLLLSYYNCWCCYCSTQGWEFAHWFFERFARFLWAKERFAREKERIFLEQPEWIAHGCSLKKSQWAKSDRSDSLLGIKKVKTVKNDFFEGITHFLRAIALIMSESLMSLFKMNNFKRKSKEWRSEREYAQPWLYYNCR